MVTSLDIIHALSKHEEALREHTILPKYITLISLKAQNHH